ncbi:hypothetical protein POX_f07516 [Penicillium oxalicum]|uniref:hypothetical protein n=1 Tax=Penicillium oxalicum TaxID=69781 RepID=UPI0020B82546|nr:hypothetical protein POX_f07516 [Penicillium oxalicum]KAI2787153.1 hypothetical protein POX_f07516 [Penicillium oxalicum]
MLSVEQTIPKGTKTRAFVPYGYGMDLYHSGLGRGQTTRTVLLETATGPAGPGFPPMAMGAGRGEMSVVCCERSQPNPNGSSPLPLILGQSDAAV